MPRTRVWRTNTLMAWPSKRPAFRPRAGRCHEGVGSTCVSAPQYWLRCSGVGCSSSGQDPGRGRLTGRRRSLNGEDRGRRQEAGRVVRRRCPTGRPSGDRLSGLGGRRKPLGDHAPHRFAPAGRHDRGPRQRQDLPGPGAGADRCGYRDRQHEHQGQAAGALVPRSDHCRRAPGRSQSRRTPALIVAGCGRRKQPIARTTARWLCPHRGRKVTSWA
jgi:hypothetical protein